MSLSVGPQRSRPGLIGAVALAAAVGMARWVARQADRGQIQPASRSPNAVDVSAPLIIAPATRLATTSARGWKDILLATYNHMNDDRLLAVAAGTVFYGLLALFPAVTALVSSYALFADGGTINDHLALLAGVVPEGAFAIIRDQVGRVLAKGDVKLGFAFLFSLSLALWSANGGMKAMMDALNVVNEEAETRGFLKLNAVSLAFTLGSLLAVLAAIGLVVAAPVALAMVGLGGVGDALLRWGRWPALAVMTLLGLAVLYRFGPARPTPWRWVTLGSLLATATWLGGSALLSFYLANFANYDATYGSLGAAIGLMVWMWMSTIVVLLGAELNSAIAGKSLKGGAAENR